MDGQGTKSTYCALSLEFMNLLGIYTVGVVSETQHSKCQKSLYLATPLAFKPPDGGVPLGRSP